MTILNKIIGKINNRIRGNISTAEPIRKDAQRISIQPDLHLEVYWKVLPNGKGPAVTLCAFDQEILKFDCFGYNDGHFHIAPYFELRIFFTEQSAREQVKRTCSELLLNTQRYLVAQHDERIKSIVVKEDNLAEAINEAGKRMIYFLETIPEIQDI